jgi:[acyl-carrier-protein] S-malonyltransferase
MTSIAFVFPGQGSQFVGMGKEFFDTFPIYKQTLEQVDDVLNENLTRIIMNGPDSDLTLTKNTQPALMTSCIAMLKVLENEFGKKLNPTLMAGHSLGEYTALCAVDVFSLTNTAKLLRIRGQSMQDAVPANQGSMAAILGLDIDSVQDIVNETKCSIANDNCPGQVVISGGVDAVEEASQLALLKGAKKAIPLSVSAPFHCSLMEPAAEKMKEALDIVDMKNATIPVISNVSVEPMKSVEEIRELLVKQVTHKVRWRETGEKIESMRVTHVIEIGPGKVLTGLLKRICTNVELHNLSNPNDIDNVLRLFS